ncbi:ABC transporter permease [Nitrosococcus wardiae]|uniref:ABC transporter permease n=1 Tax=Nitrosococcus wardiae TaxID=1814290 RepID=A0A4P7BYZ9_9GAMM|nr:ABC transporter permease [Nitrosococcus wardiae]QBQ54489.1 ABC transporter permease [Nitrosococcus wardiae]
MSESRITVYTPDSSLANPRKMVGEMFRDLLRGRELAWRLAVRDISSQYRQAFLGIFWAFITPLATTITWIFLSGSGIVSVGETNLPYPVYVFTGTLLWSILIDAMNAPTQQTNAARGMLAKLNFPREALLLSGIYKILFNTGIKMMLLIGALLLVGINPGWSLLLFPLGILSLILVGTAIGLLITPVGMLYTDVGRAVPLLMNFVMYLTPVVFPMPKEGWVATLYQINPLSPVILTARDWLTGFPPEFLGYFLVVNVAAFALLLVVWVAYRLAMPIIIERMSA